MEGKVKRSLLATYLNTAAIGDAKTWYLIGVGVTSAEISYNPTMESLVFINEDNASAVLTGYAPVMPIEAMAYEGDEAYEFIDAMRKARGILGDAEAEIMHVLLYEDVVQGIYPAEFQSVVISIESFGSTKPPIGSIFNHGTLTSIFQGNGLPPIFPIERKS